MSHMTVCGIGGFDLYAKADDDDPDLQEYYVGTFKPPFNLETGFDAIVHLPDRRMRTFTLNMPLYGGVNELYVGLDKDSTLEAAPERKYKPVAYYGSSITQGGCASRPGNSYQAILSRALDCGQVNLGFSGNGKGEPEVAEYIASMELSAFVMDYDHNAPTNEHLLATHEPFFQIIRKAQPKLPVIFVTRPPMLNDKEEAERLCPPGCYATFESEYREFGDGFVKAKALDDRAGCMILLDVLKHSSYAGDITCVFTVQEEVGLRGAKIAARRVKPDMAIILDTTTANDMGMVDCHKQVTRCGEGPALTFMDRRAIIPQKMRKLAMNAAQKRGIPVQMKRGNSGGTDAGEIHLTGAGVECLVIVIPCRYCHSGVSVCKLSDIENAGKLALAVLEDV